MSTNCVPLISDFFVYSHEAELVQSLLRDKTSKKFNHPYEYTDDVLSIEISIAE
jgi:hypothetical protein